MGNVLNMTLAAFTFPHPRAFSLGPMLDWVSLEAQANFILSMRPAVVFTSADRRLCQPTLLPAHQDSYLKIVNKN